MAQVHVWVALPDLLSDDGAGGRQVYAFPWRPTLSNWKRQPRLIAEDSLELPGRMGTASFRVLRNRYQEGATEAVGDPIVAGSYVVITAGTPGATLDPAQALWWGWLEELDERPLHGSHEVIGDARARELGTILDGTQLRGWTWAETSSALYGDPHNTPPTANIQVDDGPIIGNAIAITDDGLPAALESQYVFARKPADCGTATSQLWTRWRLLRHVLAYCINGNGQDSTMPVSLAPITIATTAEIEALLDDTQAIEAWDLRDLTLKGALDLCVPAALGLAWDLVPWLNGGSLEWRLHILATSDQAATSTHTNAKATAVDIADTSTISDLRIGANAGDLYDQVIVRCAPYRFCGVYSRIDYNLDMGWSATAESDWLTAAGGAASDEEHQRHRGRPEYADVGVRFILQSFNGFDLITQAEPVTGGVDLSSGPAYGGSIVPQVPQVRRLSGSDVVFGNEEATYTPSGVQHLGIFVSTTISRAPYLPTARVATDLPWPSGLKVDGTDNRPAEAKARQQWLKPLLFLAESDGAGGRTFTDLLADAQDETPQVEADDGGLAIRIRYRRQEHMLNAAASWEGVLQPQFDWADLVVVAAVDSDQRLEVVKTSHRSTTLRRQLVVDRPDLACWIVRKGCILGLKDDGDPERTTRNVVIRDDHYAAELIADLLAAWVFRPRRALTIESLDPTETPSWASLHTVVGQVVDTKGDATTTHQVHTPVASIHRLYRPSGGRLTVRTQVPALPPALLQARAAGGGSSPSMGGAVSIALGGTTAQATQAARHQQRQQSRDRRRMLVHPPRNAGLGDVVTGYVRTGQLIETVEGVAVNGITYKTASGAITSVPTADAGSHVGTIPDNLGIMRRIDTGEDVWVCTYYDRGDGNGPQTPQGLSIIVGMQVSSVATIILPADDDPGGAGATVYLPIQQG